jgi:hypothetical protein
MKTFAITVKSELDKEDLVVSVIISRVYVSTETFLTTAYKEIDCGIVDLVSADGCDIWVDDEGLLTSGKLIIEWAINGKKLSSPLAGNLLITKGVDDEGNTLFYDEGDMNDLPSIEALNIVGITK